MPLFTACTKSSSHTTTGLHRLLEVTPVSLLVVSRSLNSLFKVLFNFRLRYLFAIGLAVIFSLRRCIPPTSNCTLEQSYSQAQAFVLSSVDLQCTYGTSTHYGQLLGNSFVHTPANKSKLKHRAHTQHRRPLKMSSLPLRWASSCSLAVTKDITFVFFSTA